jgi:hypothetical protein
MAEMIPRPIGIAMAAGVSVALAFLVLLMKRSVAEKGAHIAAE